MRDGKGMKIGLSFLFVVLISILTVVYTHINRDSIVETDDEEVMGESNMSGVPYIVSLAPITGYEGLEYEYIVKVVDRDTDLKILSLEYVSGPEWLELNGLLLAGIPPIGSSGTYKVVLRISDGYNSSIQESYILIEEYDR